jgi:Ca2+-dependent lipid-binding protein
MAQGRLRVTIVEAAKLVDKDKMDFNDPYVEVYIDEKQKQKTATINNDERPVWNETFDLYVMIYFFVSHLNFFFFYAAIYGRVMNISI